MSSTTEQDQAPSNSTDEKQEQAGEWIDLMGEDLQMKAFQSEDDNLPTCEVGSAVVVDFVGRQASSRNDENGPIFHEAKDWLIVVGDKDVTPALEMGIRFLQEGNRAIVYSHSKYAYGPNGRSHGDYELPANSNVTYEIHVKKIVDASAVEIARSRKQMGNDCYQYEWSNGNGKGRALHLYKKAADAMNDVLVDSPDNDDARSILVDCLNNTAAVNMRAKEYGKAKEAATRVLIHDPNNIKALCRAARAAMMDPAGTYEESDAAIAAAEQVKGDDPDVIKLRAELERRKKDYKRKSKAMFSKMGTSKNSKAKGAVKESVAAAEVATDTEKEMADDLDEVSKAENKSWFEIFWPYIMQMGLTFVIYFLFTQMTGHKDNDGLLSKVQEQEQSMDPTTEF